MKRYHWILILVIAVAAAFLLRQRHEIRERELSLAAAGKVGNSTDTAHSMGNRQDETTKTKREARAEQDTFDPEAYVAKLDRVIASASSDPGDRYVEIMGTLIEHGEELKTASPATLRETCQMIEKSGLDPDRMKVWKTLVGLVAKSDPVWAIQQLDRVMKSENAEDRKMDILLEDIDRMGRGNKREWSPEYARAFGSWLDSAQASGRLDGLDHQIAKLRGNIALTQGDLSGAAVHLPGMPATDRGKIADGIIQSAASPTAYASLIGQVAGSGPAVAELSRALARKESLEVTRTALDQAKLSGEDFGHAVFGAATARFGTDTPARADWLLDSLPNNQTELVTDFASEWTRNDFRSAAQWLGSLPDGPIRDAAVSGFVPDAARLDGASATDWALTVSDQSRREAMLRQIYDTWHAQDPEQSRAYFEEHQIAIPSPK